MNKTVTGREINMPKMISIHDNLAVQLDRLKTEMTLEKGVGASYGAVIKRALKRAKMWKKPTEEEYSKKIITNK